MAPFFLLFLSLQVIANYSNAQFRNEDVCSSLYTLLSEPTTQSKSSLLSAHPYYGSCYKTLMGHFFSST